MAVLRGLLDWAHYLCFSPIRSVAGFFPFGLGITGHYWAYWAFLQVPAKLAVLYVYIPFCLVGMPNHVMVA